MAEILLEAVEEVFAEVSEKKFVGVCGRCWNWLRREGLVMEFTP